MPAFALGVTELVEARLYALSNPYELDGRVSSHPANVRGFGQINCYLLLEKDCALLVDTGFSYCSDSLLAQIESIIDRSLPMALYPLVLGEFASLCNVRPIAEHFNVHTIIGTQDDVTTWCDFLPDLSRYGTPVAGGALEKIRSEKVRVRDTIIFDPEGRRPLESFAPPLRILPSQWLYDAETHTAFTADCFNYMSRPTGNGPWVVGETEPVPSVEDVYPLLAEGRFWWLPGADTDPIVVALDEFFARFEVLRIAPRAGCIIEGASQVQSHWSLLKNVLAFAAKQAPVPFEALPRWNAAA